MVTLPPFAPDDLDRALALVEPRMRALLAGAEGRVPAASLATEETPGELVAQRIGL